MRLKNLFLLGVLLSGLGLFPGAQGDQKSALEQKATEISRITEEYEKYREELEETFVSENLQAKDRMSRIINKIEDELLEFDEFRQQREEAEAKLFAARKKLGTLNGQLSAIESSLELTQTEVKTVQLQIMKRVAEVKYLLEEAERLKGEKASQKKAVVEFFSLLQYENEEFGVSDETRNVLRLLLSDGSFSENLWEAEQIAAMEKIGRKVFHGLEEAENELISVTRLVNEENKKLNKLHDQKSIEEQRLAEQLTTKKMLLEKVKSNEEEFQKLLDESKRQMQESAQSIGILLQDKESLREKMDLLEKEQRRIDSERTRETQAPIRESNYEVGERFIQEDSSKAKFRWPVPPLKGISAYFRDPSYKEVFNVAHQAIDIPTPQGTEIVAPALGYVYKVTDNGMGYSSLIVAHRDNLMTVYGHVSEFLVKEGDLVQAGTPIALSGGAPGTKGAGWMTTGAHLHFEVFLNGEHVDPLPYLPQEELPGKS